MELLSHTSLPPNPVSSHTTAPVSERAGILRQREGARSDRDGGVAVGIRLDPGKNRRQLRMHEPRSPQRVMHRQPAVVARPEVRARASHFRAPATSPS